MKDSSGLRWQLLPVSFHHFSQSATNEENWVSMPRMEMTLLQELLIFKDGNKEDYSRTTEPDSVLKFQTFSITSGKPAVFFPEGLALSHQQ